MDSTIAAVAVPAIINDPSLSTTEVESSHEIYTLVFASLLSGRGADRVCLRWILMLGFLIFVASSAL